MTRDLEEHRLEILRQRVQVEADIARTLNRILMLLEACVQNSPWASQIMRGVYEKEYKREP